MKIFIVHYSKLIDRKKHLLNQFEKQNIVDYEFIEKYDKEDLQDSDKLIFEPSLKEAQKSIINKMLHIYKIIAEKHENALVFEDDVILSNNFNNILNGYITQLPEDYDMLFIGDGCNLHIEKNKLIPNKNIYEKCLYPTSWGGDGASRCSDSYMISNKCAKKMCEYVENLNSKINLPSDWWLNVAARDNNFKVYWVEPTIVTQGSQFASSNI
jgi:GR25 family glycosyltransferase involved in LPS biosynthesis